MKARLIILCSFLFLGCLGFKNGYKELDLNAFKITVPADWKYKKLQGIDSFIGKIVGPKTNLAFDCSDMGYANHLIYSEEEWLKREESGWSRSVDIAYTNTPKTIAKPTIEQKRKYPKADYIVEFALKDSTIIIPVEVPSEIKSHHIQIDTTSEYIIKTIYPKIAGKGLTGIYIKKKNSSFNFQMNAKYLPKQQQEQALQAFKTIKFKQ